MPGPSNTTDSTTIAPVVEVLPRPTAPVPPAKLVCAASAALQGALDAAAMWARMRPIVAEYIEVLEEVMRKQKEYAATYTPANHDDFVREAHATISSIVAQVDRVSRAQMAMMKSADTAARLAVFLEGPQDEDDLKNKSVAELEKIVRGAVEALDSGRS